MPVVLTGVDCATWREADRPIALKLQRPFPAGQEPIVVATGSVAEVGGRRGVPYVGRGGAGRDLGLYWWHGAGRGEALPFRSLPFVHRRDHGDHNGRSHA